MNYFVTALTLCAFSSGAFAADATCKDQATEKKLAGAAMTSFMTKCEKDATAACDADSKAKKLAGAALTTHMKKCVADKTGTAAAAPAGAPAAK